MKINFEFLKVEILHNLKQKKLSQNYYSIKKKYEIIYSILRVQKKILFFIIFFLMNFFLILKATIIQIFQKKIKKKFLVIVDEKKIDQIANLLVYKILNHNSINFAVINKTKREILKRYINKQNQFKYEIFFSIDVFIKYIYNLAINLKEYFLFLKKNKFLSINKFYLFSIYLRFNYDYCLIKKIHNYFNPEYIYINQNSLNQQNIIATFKNINPKIQIIGNCFNGLALSNQKITGQYLWNNIDHLLCYGQLDFDEFKKIKKKNYLFPPKNLYIIGSPRDYVFKIKDIQNKSKLNILFIKSNPNMQNNIDDKALKLVLKTFDMLEFQKNISLTVKDRAQSNQQSNINDLIEKYQTSTKIIKSEKKLTETLIVENDLILGTYSTSFIYQSIYFKKPIIQIYGNKIYWIDLTKEGIITCNNEINLKKQITKFYFNKNSFTQNYKKKIIKLRKKMFYNGNVENNLEKKIIRLIN